MIFLSRWLWSVVTGPWSRHVIRLIGGRASNEGYQKVPEDFTITITRAFSWLTVPTSAFTFTDIIRHYAENFADLRFQL